MAQCHHETLAQNELVHVQRCRECGGLTVHVGPVSVRLEERALTSLLGVLGEATAQLAARRSAPAATQKPGLA